MATFKVGQRVRIVNAEDIRRDCRGLEGTVVSTNCPRTPGYPIAVFVEGHPSGAMDGTWIGDEAAFVPLTDPGADAFLERIRKLKPYDEPKVREPVAIPSGEGLPT